MYFILESIIEYLKQWLKITTALLDRSLQIDELE